LTECLPLIAFIMKNNLLTILTYAAS